MTTVRRAILIAAVAWAAAAGEAIAADPPFAVRCGAYIDRNGARVDHAVIVVRDGKIAEIGLDAAPPAGAVVLDRTDAVVGPGFIDVHVALGTAQRSGEAANAIESDADAADLFNRHHHDFDRAVRAGVTTVLIAPASSHLVGGVTATVKTAGKDSAGRRLAAGPLNVSIAPGTFTLNRPPTSLQGGLDELRKMIVAARADGDPSSFGRWARGETAAIVDTVGAEELGALARFAKSAGVQCVAVHANYAVERLADVRTLGRPVVLGAYDFSDPRRFTRVPSMLAENDVPFALTSGAPRFGPELLRIGAAIAMSQGLSAADAWAAVTTTPATIAGVGDRVGSLEVGKDADFVVFSGDPFDLSSRILEVFVNGERVFRARNDDANNGVGE